MIPDVKFLRKNQRKQQVYCFMKQMQPCKAPDEGEIPVHSTNFPIWKAQTFGFSSSNCTVNRKKAKQYTVMDNTLLEEINFAPKEAFNFMRHVTCLHHFWLVGNLTTYFVVILPNFEKAVTTTKAAAEQRSPPH